jgi:thymidylate kinase
MSSEAPPSGSRPPSGPLVVEFLGMPGSGKTTLAAALVALLEERGTAAATIVGAARARVRRTRVGRIAARLPFRRLRRFVLWQLFYLFGAVDGLRFGAEHGALMRHALDTQRRRHDRIRTRAHVLYWFFHLCGRYRFLVVTSGPREVLVLCDGFLQRSVHLHASPVDPPDAEQVGAYVDLVPAPDFVVRLIVDRAICERRVRARGIWPHLRHLDAPALSRFLEHAEQAVAAAACRADRKGWPIIEVETGAHNPMTPSGALNRLIPALVQPGGHGPAGDAG